MPRKVYSYPPLLAVGVVLAVAPAVQAKPATHSQLATARRMTLKEWTAGLPASYAERFRATCAGTRKRITCTVVGQVGARSFPGTIVYRVIAGKLEQVSMVGAPPEGI